MEQPDNACDPAKNPARGGEPIRFLAPKKGMGAFLHARGFSQLRITSEDKYRLLYFNRKKEGRELLATSSFVYAVVWDR